MNYYRALIGAVAGFTAGSRTMPKARSQATIMINAPIEKVWGLVVDIDHWPRWNKSVETAHLKGAVAKGSVFDWKSGGFGIRSTFQDVVPMKRLSWTGQTLGTSALHSWEFTITGKGVVVTTAETFDGWLPSLMPGTMQKKLDDTLPALLASLKVAAEG
jgi:uncharacterized protein YndB with AHSA1/START domain